MRGAFSLVREMLAKDPAYSPTRLSSASVTRNSGACPGWEASLGRRQEIGASHGEPSEVRVECALAALLGEYPGYRVAASSNDQDPPVISGDPLPVRRPERGSQPVGVI